MILLIASTLTGCLSFSNDDSDSEATSWSMERGNKRRTGRSPYEVDLSDPEIRWNNTIDGFPKSHPVIDKEGNIYVTTRDGKLYSLDPNGTHRWNLTLGGDITTSPAINSSGTLFVGSHDGRMYAVRQNGTIEWDYQTNQSISSAPVIDDNMIYFGSRNSYFYAIDMNGELRWKFKTEDYIFTNSAIGPEDNVYLVSNHTLYSLNSDGELNWKHEAKGFGPVISEDGTIYVFGMKIYAFQKDGTLIWSHNNSYYIDEETELLHPPSIGSDGTLYTTAGITDQLLALKPNGELKWKASKKDGISSYPPVVDKDGTVIVGSYDGTGSSLLAINSQGAIEWSVPIDVKILTGFAIGENGDIYTTGGYPYTEDYIFAVGEK